MEPTIPPPAIAARGALMLDFDGTLVPFAPTPDAVHVPPALTALLDRLLRAMRGRVAIVTGRPLDTLDRLLAPLRLAAAAEHGLVLRPDAAAQAARLPAPSPDPAWLEAAEDLARAHPGVVLERKSAGFVLHWRQAPHAAAAVAAAMAGWAAADPRFRLLPAAMAIELRPHGIDKGTGLAALMAAPPFADHLPVFIGDDVTDEDAIAAAQRLGGIGLRMAESFLTHERLHDWLAAVAHAAEHDDAAAA